MGSGSEGGFLLVVALAEFFERFVYSEGNLNVLVFVLVIVAWVVWSRWGRWT